MSQIFKYISGKSSSATFWPTVGTVFAEGSGCDGVYFDLSCESNVVLPALSRPRSNTENSNVAVRQLTDYNERDTSTNLLSSSSASTAIAPDGMPCWLDVYLKMRLGGYVGKTGNLGWFINRSWNSLAAALYRIMEC